MSRFTYRPEILEALEPHGMRPRSSTDPSKAYGLLKAIYTFEVRELRLRRQEAERLLGPQPLEPHRRRLRELRERYPALRWPAHHWVVHDQSTVAQRRDDPLP